MLYDTKRTYDECRFDGEGMVHAVHFQDGQAKSYSNHWLRTKRFLAEAAAGSNLFLRVSYIYQSLTTALFFPTFGTVL